MKEQVIVETVMAVGSLKFKEFGELYNNIKGRTDGFSSSCSILHDGKVISSFPIKYEKNNGRERFVLELNQQEMSSLLVMPKEAVSNLKGVLPGFQRVGCSAEGYISGQKYFGYIRVDNLLPKKMSM